MCLLNTLTDVFTIVGVIFAITIYFFWKRDYKSQKSHEYALELMRKIRHLHLEVELLRSPKFYRAESVIKDIHDNYIPKIQERILDKAVEIQVDLLVSKSLLIKHNDLQKEFREKINPILGEVQKGIYLFRNVKNENDLHDSLLWKIIFPAEQPGELEIKSSMLGTGAEVIDDDFNKKIEKEFNNIYKILYENMISKDLMKETFHV